ncbi:MAG: phenylalanine--tRNA ligase subunit beta [Pseudomonadota bacterium]|nr:phenylalanine--tRNA ligase subunit beta [Pseudomonadota bacterium]
MKISIKWLRDYVDFDVDPADLAESLTMAGLEVDAIERAGPAFDGVVVARILSVRPHPQSDKLRLCEVTTGSAPLPIVCGAPNVAAGATVALARVGAVIPGGYVIKSSRLRGEPSEGMLCSEEELGIGEDNKGIMILPPEMPLGMDLKEALGLLDTVLDIGVTPNRADCLSIVGIAREVAAITGSALRYPDTAIRENEEATLGIASVTIEDPDLCPRYTARIIKNIKIKASPAWMRERLEAVGLRAINNIVDVTNFVMMELGQPLHAFDYRFLEEGRIVVRRAREGEPFVSLDGKERLLKADTLMICDGVKPVAIAGIMGGLNSEVKDDTSTILLESAYFHPASIRRSSRWLGMGTDAAFRFERGIDPEGVVRALNRAAQLMAELGDGEICRGYIDVYPRQIGVSKDIPLRGRRVRAILGADISGREAAEILERLEMTVVPTGDDDYRVTPPTCRVDIHREIDLIEEVARIHGFPRIPVAMPASGGAPGRENPRHRREGLLRAAMNGLGYKETINYSFINPIMAEQFGLPEGDPLRSFVKIRNPLTEEQAVMRTNLVYGLLEVMERNARNGCADLKIFEIGRVFLARGEEELPEERPCLAALVTGSRYDSSWHHQGVMADFYDLKGALEALLAVLKITGARFVATAEWPFLHPGRACRVMIGEEVAGFLGEIHPRVRERLDLRSRALVFQLELDSLAVPAAAGRSFREISKYPASSRDVAFLAPAVMEGETLCRAAYGQHEALLERVSIFDVYSSKNLPEGMKSIGLRFSYRSDDRTLREEEVNSAHDRIVKNMMAATGAMIRGE